MILKDKKQPNINYKGIYGFYEEEDVKEAVLLFDKLLKSDKLSDAECGNDKMDNITWNQYIKRNRQRIKEVFGDFEEKP